MVYLLSVNKFYCMLFSRENNCKSSSFPFSYTISIVYVL